MRSQTDFIAVHCSATKASQDIGVAEIDEWHKARGWSGCGYHAVIRRNGRLEFGRPFDAVGAHVRGFNGVSVGICLVGGLSVTGEPEDNFTPEQMATMVGLVEVLQDAYPHAVVRGHRDFPNVDKACPCFDVSEVFAL